jgi:hypothetical protein
MNAFGGLIHNSAFVDPVRATGSGLLSTIMD